MPEVKVSLLQDVEVLRKLEVSGELIVARAIGTCLTTQKGLGAPLSSSNAWEDLPLILASL